MTSMNQSKSVIGPSVESILLRYIKLHLCLLPIGKKKHPKLRVDEEAPLFKDEGFLFSLPNSFISLSF